MTDLLIGVGARDAYASKNLAAISLSVVGMYVASVSVRRSCGRGIHHNRRGIRMACRARGRSRSIRMLAKGQHRRMCIILGFI